MDGMALASAPRRLGAFLIDRAIKTALLLAVLSIAGIPWPTEPMVDPTLTAASALLNAGYDFVFGIRGVSPAAYLLKIRIAASHGGEPGVRRSLIRAVAASLNELVLFSGAIWMFFDSRRRTLMDRVADTIVTRTDR